MWTHGLIYPITLLLVQVSRQAEGALLEQISEELTNIKDAFEACVKIGNTEGILESIDGILDTYYKDVLTPDFEGKVTKEQWFEVLTSDGEKETELLNNLGVKEDLFNHLDAVFLRLNDFCKEKNPENTVDDVIVWNDPASFGRDLVATLFKFWEQDEDVEEQPEEE